MGLKSLVGESGPLFSAHRPMRFRNFVHYFKYISPENKLSLAMFRPFIY